MWLQQRDNTRWLNFHNSLPVQTSSFIYSGRQCCSCVMTRFVCCEGRCVWAHVWPPVPRSSTTLSAVPRCRSVLMHSPVSKSLAAFAKGLNYQKGFVGAGCHLFLLIRHSSWWWTVMLRLILFYQIKERGEKTVKRFHIKSSVTLLWWMSQLLKHCCKPPAFASPRACHWSEPWQ